jgi:hypothetical protein
MQMLYAFARVVVGQGCPRIDYRPVSDRLYRAEILH